ncbi:SAVED domain-containing protein [Undibacterium sp.]|uniref:SAVED domain-containing protein n=1 Tax=Undibacterium sp. TaxID=1914977 RepID=UPI0025E0A281|nr:SAVED domain-containing protein [Undibacterium sp.]
MKHHLYDLYKRLVERYFRVRTVGTILVQGGLRLLIALLATGLVGSIFLRLADFKLKIQGGTGNGLPNHIFYAAVAVSAIMIGAGLLLMWRDERREKRKLLVVIEVRGLHSSPDSPAKDTIKPSFTGQRHPVLVDFRPSLAGELVNPQLMLDKIRGMKLNVESAVQGRDMSDVFVAIGGVASVPGLFYVGMRMDDESHFELYDWNRDLKRWNPIDGLDDGNRPRPLEIPQMSAEMDEVVLAVSASYLVDDVAIALSFPSLPVVRMSAKIIQANSYWAEEVQQAFATAFRDAVQEMMTQNIRRIHLVLAAPASLAVRLGATYDERLHPELIVYQYERSSTPPYPWGIFLPHHGSPEPKIHLVASMGLAR